MRLGQAVTCSSQIGKHEMKLMVDSAGQLDASYTLFSLMCIGLWARQFLDGNMFGGASDRVSPLVDEGTARGQIL